MAKPTPQEKKVLSYEKDRRNDYRENDKASRRLIPLRKAGVNRGYRRKIAHILLGISSAADLEQIESIADNAGAIKRDEWKKAPDIPLREMVQRKIEWRKRHAGKGRTALKKAREYASNLKIEVRQHEDGYWIASASGVKDVTVRRASSKEAIWVCKWIMEAYFLESLGVHEVVSVDGPGIHTRKIF